MTQTSSIHNNGRIHSMDAIRAIAMLLGVVLHATISYKLTPLPSWPIDNTIHSIYFNYLYLLIHSFRMQLFFLVAGFFARFLYFKIGRKAFIRHRIRRILYPFVVCLVIIVPLSMLPFYYYEQTTMHPHWEAMQKLISALPQMFKWRGMAHLWFLYYLIIYYTAMLLLQQVSSHIQMKEAIITIGKKVLAFPKIKSLFALMLPVFSITCLFPRLPLEPYVGFKPDIPLMIYYLFFFLLGYFIHKFYSDKIAVFSNGAIIYFTIGIAITPLIGHLDLLQFSNNSMILFLVIRLLFSIQTILLVIGFLGIFVKYLNSENHLIRYISDASYWIYLIHLPIVVWLQVLLINSQVPPIFRFWIVNIIGIGIPLATYALLVRYTFIGRSLNGPRKKRRKAPAENFSAPKIGRLEY